MPHLVAEVAAPGLAVVGRPVGLPVPGEVAAGAVLLAADVAAEPRPAPQPRPRPRPRLQVLGAPEVGQLQPRLVRPRHGQHGQLGQGAGSLDLVSVILLEVDQLLLLLFLLVIILHSEHCVTVIIIIVHVLLLDDNIVMLIHDCLHDVILLVHIIIQQLLLNIHQTYG